METVPERSVLNAGERVVKPFLHIVSVQLELNNPQMLGPCHKLDSSPSRYARPSRPHLPASYRLLPDVCSPKQMWHWNSETLSEGCGKSPMKSSNVIDHSCQFFARCRLKFQQGSNSIRHRHKGYTSVLTNKTRIRFTFCHHVQHLWSIIACTTSWECRRTNKSGEAYSAEINQPFRRFRI